MSLKKSLASQQQQMQDTVSPFHDISAKQNHKHSIYIKAIINIDLSHPCTYY